MVRLAASLEHLPFDKKLQLIEWLFGRLQKTQYAQAHWWAIGRIATRILFMAVPIIYYQQSMYLIAYLN